MSVCVWWTGGKLLNITSVCSFNRFLYQMWLFRTLQQQNVSSVWFLSERECDMWVEHLWSWAWCPERISWNEFPFTGCLAQPEETRLSGGAQRRTAAPNVERRQLKQFSIFSGCPQWILPVEVFWTHPAERRLEVWHCTTIPQRIWRYVELNVWWFWRIHLWCCWT